MATNTYIEPYKSKPMDSMTDPTGCYNRECTSYCACKVYQWTGKWMKHTGDFDAKHWVARLAEHGYKTIVKAPVAGGKYIGVSTLGQYGHVVASEGSLEITEYNYPQPQFTGAFHVRTVKATDFTWVEIVSPNPVFEWSKFDHPTKYTTRLDTTHLWCVNHTNVNDCHSVKKYAKGATLTFYGTMKNKNLGATYLVTEDNYKNRIPVGFNRADMTEVAEQQPTLEWQKLDAPEYYECKLDTTHLWDVNHTNMNDCRSIIAFKKGAKIRACGKLINKELGATYLQPFELFENKIVAGFNAGDMQRTSIEDSEAVGALNEATEQIKKAIELIRKEK